MESFKLYKICQNLDLIKGGTWEGQWNSETDFELFKTVSHKKFLSFLKHLTPPSLLTIKLGN